MTNLPIAKMINNPKGLNIVGQGGKIILFVLPVLISAIYLHVNYPETATLGNGNYMLKTLGYILLIPGLVLWGGGVVQLLTGFPKGKLMTSGAYAVVRNPIYSSVTWFILPAVSAITSTWVYVVAALFLLIGVNIFIAEEERQLKKVFGKEYENYLRRVDRMIPFWRS